MWQWPLESGRPVNKVRLFEGVSICAVAIAEPYVVNVALTFVVPVPVRNLFIGLVNFAVKDVEMERLDERHTGS